VAGDWLKRNFQQSTDKSLAMFQVFFITFIAADRIDQVTVIRKTILNVTAMKPSAALIFFSNLLESPGAPKKRP
jgi:hypothetical protein